MTQQRLIKGLFIGICLGLIFFFANWMSQTTPLMPLITKSILIAIVFIVLYVLVFSLLSSEQRKLQYGPPLIICVILGILAGVWLNLELIGALVGIVIGLLIGYIRGRK